MEDNEKRYAADETFAMPPPGFNPQPLAEDFEQSPTLAAILPAMVAMQGALEPARRDAKNPFHGSTYADLAAVMAVLRRPLADNGLCLVHQHSAAPEDDGAIIVHSRLYHTSGEYFGCRLKIRVDVPSKKERERGLGKVQPTAQELGSATTYGKRYNTMALTNVVAEGEDDDGNRASNRRRDEQEGPGEAQGRERGQRRGNRPPQDAGSGTDEERAARKRAENERLKREALEKAGKAPAEGETAQPPAGGGGQDYEPPAPKAKETDAEIVAKSEEVKATFTTEEMTRFVNAADEIVNAPDETAIVNYGNKLQNPDNKTPEQATADARLFAVLRPLVRKTIKAMRAKNKPPKE